jgi:hypothetical protein
MYRKQPKAGGTATELKEHQFQSFKNLPKTKVKRFMKSLKNRYRSRLTLSTINFRVPKSKDRLSISRQSMRRLAIRRRYRKRVLKKKTLTLSTLLGGLRDDYAPSLYFVYNGKAHTEESRIPVHVPCYPFVKTSNSISLLSSLNHSTYSNYGWIFD